MNQAVPCRSLERSLPRRPNRGSLPLLVVVLLLSLIGRLPAQGFDVPADRKLGPNALRALIARGVPEVYQGAALQNIRMPIGGICSGSMYLSGEGRLTAWQINERFVSIEQGFTLRTTTGGKTAAYQLTRRDFPAMTFRGEYPLARFEYRNPSVPIATSLEAFSPFIPLRADESGWPATIFTFTLKNTSHAAVEATLAGGLENGVCNWSRYTALGIRRNRIVRGPRLTVLHCTVAPAEANAAARADIVFEAWNKPTFAPWIVAGDAFGFAPLTREAVQKTDGNWRLDGTSSHFALCVGRKGVQGKLQSPSFTIQRNYINFSVGGGSEERPLVKLLVDGAMVPVQTGMRDCRFVLHAFDVRKLQGKEARLEFFADFARLGIGRITFSDTPGDGTPLAQWPDYGSMALGLLGPAAEVSHAQGGIGFDEAPCDEASAPLAEPLIGALGRTVTLQPGASAVVTYVVTWHFPNLEMRKLGKVGCYYATKYPCAQAVAEQVAAGYGPLAEMTRLWRDTWYDSTLPFWFLDRTFLNTSTLATSACYRFANGRFYAYEGAPAPNFPGTCTHVWQYAQAAARVFPELERDTRERVDLGIALDPKTGVIGFRGETGLAVDGQAGTILRFYREHQMSPDNSFLTRNWEKIKLAFRPLFALDAREEGVLDGPQNNTLDCVWYGQNSWMSSMYVAALRGGEAMAEEMGDRAFADRCRTLAQRGSRNIVARLYNGEYFNSRIDPARAGTMNSGNGSFIDQVYGQSWAFQVGLPRVLPLPETRGALAALWKYNFIPDAWPYANSHRPGRIFVKPGDAGMVMCTFPRADWDITKASGGSGNKDGFRFAKYFNETWTGQEYQVAAHMLWEGMVLEGLTLVRAIHDRYSPLKRNPWAEEEAGIHYARAMASYGVYLAACGFEYHGPRGHIGFAPRITPEEFRAPFITAEGWGTFAQTITSHSMHATLAVKWGQLKLRTMDLTLARAPQAPTVRAQLGSASVPAICTIVDDRVHIRILGSITISAGQSLSLTIDW